MRPGFACRLAVALCVVSALACDSRFVDTLGQDPRIGGVPATVPPPEGYRIQITGASLNGSADAPRQLYVNFKLSKDGKPISGAAATPLQPTWTLAALGTEPVSGAPAWRNLLFTGAETIPSLPTAGPGSDATCVDPAAPCPGVLQNQQQPGPDPMGGQVLDHGDGTFTYIYKTTFSGIDPTGTLRVGVFLAGVPGTLLTNATKDFRPDGGAIASRELVLAKNCSGCHGNGPKAHGGHRVGPDICVTCHTYQHADPDTMDPAAMASAGATPATNPNPLEFGRLVHRIHRGRNLPTLYLSSTSNVTAPVAVPLSPAPASIAAPFSASRNAAALTITPMPEFTVVGEEGKRHTFGHVTVRADNGQPSRTMLLGVTFPRDLRSCDACHAGAKQGGVVNTELSRRTCQGCHPDVWFGTGSPDVTHLPHPGGPQSTDGHCADCHRGTGTTPYAPIEAVHVVPYLSPKLDAPVLEIVSVKSLMPDGTVVDGLRAGAKPRIRFKLHDRSGAISPLNAPTPLTDADHPLPRAIKAAAVTGDPAGTLSITVGGPTTDYLLAYSGNPPVAYQPITESLCRTGTTTTTASCIPVNLTADADGVFEHTFGIEHGVAADGTPLPPRPAEEHDVPPDATGTWAVAMEARRYGSPQKYVAPVAATSTAPAKPGSLTWPLVWPYTGESVSEVAFNPIAYFDLQGGTPAPRRESVVTERCNACHLRLTMHGARRNVQYCVMCHTADRTDWGKRPKDPAGLPTAGQVNLSTVYTWTPPFTSTSYGTNDDVEERTYHFKVFIHRNHTGGNSGSADLSALAPYVTYAGTGATGAKYRDEILFPGNLADCTRCHAPGAYRLEAVPATASPTISNETATIAHTATVVNGTVQAATLVHSDACLRTPPLTASCTSCHANAYAMSHAQRYTSDGKEQCLACHGEGATYAAGKVHNVFDPDAPVLTK